MIRPFFALALSLACLAVPATFTRAADAPAATAAAAAGDIKLALMDGSVLTGKLGTDSIDVQTKYGLLKIPLADIRSFTPGLASHTDYSEKLSALIGDLGADGFAEREKATEALRKMGPEIRAELEKALKTAETEKQARLTKLIEEIDAAKQGDDEAPTDTWSRLDTIVTSDFTIAGSITNKTFAVTSNYGALTVKLSDIKNVKRDESAPEEIRKTVTVSGTLIPQRGFEDSKIKLNRGDTVIITASGSISMPPWGGNMSSSPDGGGNFGMQQPGNLTGGALIAKINSNGTLFKVGSKNTFTADKAGVLMFGVAMQNNYEGYQFPGEYSVKIRIVRKGQ